MNEKISLSRRIKIKVLNFLMYLSFILILALVGGLIGYICFRGLPNISWKFLSSKPSLLKDVIGILPNILNTLYIVLITLVIVLPLGVGTAVYLNEYARNRKLVSDI